VAFDYKTVPLPASWPGTQTPGYQRVRSKFKTNWGGTLELLDREIRYLNGKQVELAIGVTPRDIRNDGGVRADARIQNPAVILSFTSGADRLQFPCDNYNWWQDNVRAIALAMEALRAVDRHGVQQGRQYQGFKALPSSTNGQDVTVEQALQTIRDASGLVLPNALAQLEPATAKDAVRRARARAHPDAGGNPDLFQKVQNAAAVLSGRVGVTL
jgi:hypothetical protein